MAHRSITTRFDSNGNQGLQVGSNDGHITYQLSELRSEHQTRSGPLRHLPFAEDAPFNARSKECEPLCLDNTRVALLREIHGWTGRQDEPCIFWLRGLAGTGKSTIARTIARSYHDSQRLAASFFFSRGGRDVGRAGMFVTSIAVQLADNVPASKRHICEAAAAHTTIASQSLRDQWQRLVLGPLSQLCDIDCPASLVLVVDALDECDSEYDIQNIVQLLTEAQSLARVRLRVLLTSRPEESIRNKFYKIEHRSVELQNLSTEVVAKDIDLFLKHQFAHIRVKGYLGPDWPGEEVINSFVRKASGLFIWAATACRFIGEGDDRPDEQLRKIIEGGSYNSILTPEAHLDGIYVTVLQASIPRHYSAKAIQGHYTSLRAVLGSIVTLLSPLSVEALSNALSFKTREICRILRDLHAILAVPSDNKEPLRLHHPSFRDFLLSGDRCTDANFLVDEQQAHEQLVDSCIQLMSSSLKEDVCEVNDSGKFVAEVKSEYIKQCLPLELQYACTYWIQHLVKSSALLRDDDTVHRFLQKHYLHWLEVLGWIGKVSEGIRAISSLESIAMPSKCPKLYAFVHDMKRFALYSRFGIEQAPLQVYCIAIVFAPSASLIKRQFPGKIGWLKNFPIVNSNWSAVLQTLEGHSGMVRTVAFSPDGKVLASGSSDMTAKLWEVGTGAVLHTLQGHLRGVKIVVFSPDGRVLVTVTEPDDIVFEGARTVKLWEANTGALLQTLESHWGWFSHISFSPNGKELALISKQKTVELWNVNTGKRLQRLEYPSGKAWEVAFSPSGMALALISDFGTVSLLDICENAVVWTVKSYDSEILDLSSNGKTLALLSSCTTVKLLDATTGAVVQELKGYSDRVDYIVLSPNGKVLAMTSDTKIRLWNVGTDTMLQTLEGDLIEGNRVTFSPDSKLLLLESFLMFELWDVSTCTVLQSLATDSNIVRDVVFSPDGKMLASGADDMTVKLWDAGIEMGAQTLEDLTTFTDAIGFSPDGKVLASLHYRYWSEDEPMVKLWDTDTGAIVHTLDHLGPVSDVTFSHDSMQLALASEDKAIRIWNIKSGACLHILEGQSHGYGVGSVAFSHDSKRLVSVSWSAGVKIWDMCSGACLQTFSGCPSRLSAVAFSPDSKVLALSAADETIQLWDVDQGALLQTLKGHLSDINIVAFSQDYKMLASASRDKIVHLWDLSSKGGRVQVLNHSSNVLAIAFSPDGKLLASGSEDKTIKLWDVEKGVLLKTHHIDDIVSKLLFSDDAAFLLTNRGRISTGVSLTTSLLPQITLPEVFVHEQWIVYKGKRKLWLPPEYRAECVAVHNNVVALGHSSGRVSFLEVAF